MQQHRVQKLLSNWGYCSRRKAEQLIEEGRVKVDGKTITIGDKATEEQDIRVNNKPVSKPRRVYIMLNKPRGCVTALTDPQHKTVMAYMKGIKERVFPVGRLDYNTSGLLLFTNDGDFANKIMHPSHRIKKRYLVTVDKPITDSVIKELESGVVLTDGKAEPVNVVVLSPTQLELTIHEGKNRIIRRMCEALGLKVKDLRRVRIGKLALGDIKVGRFKYLYPKEVKRVFL